MFDKAQLFGFSDGVFAIASTLLIININTPFLQKAFVSGQYSEVFQQILTYAITFLIIAFYWISHHRFFTYVKALDSRLLWLNIFLLMLIAFIPFPSSIVNGQSAHQNAEILYSATLGTAGLCLTGMWIYAANHRKTLLLHQIKKETTTYNIIRNFIASAIFLLSIVISFFNVSLAMYSWLLIFVARILLKPFFAYQDTFPKLIF